MAQVCYGYVGHISTFVAADGFSESKSETGSYSTKKKHYQNCIKNKWLKAWRSPGPAHETDKSSFFFYSF